MSERALGSDDRAASEGKLTMSRSVFCRVCEWVAEAVWCCLPECELDVEGGREGKR